ncbi:MAG: rRNA pseudouridine synthase [Neisseriaceae bacterium]|nr:rRNA pseudouridine synthase [Neisseriaceae bacterium]
MPVNQPSGSLNKKIKPISNQNALSETGADFNAKKKSSAMKAKKMTLRRPNKDILHKSEKLREIRSEIEKPVRLQKALSSAGLGSRRHCEELISLGVVKINGKIAQLGDRVLPKDEITVKDKAVKPVWQDRLPRIILYYKQEGEIVSRDDPQGRLSVFDRLPQVSGSLWVAIGRLDINTAGLLIFTTSGELANRFAHPSFAIDREYRIKVNGELTAQQIKQLTTDGIMLEDGIAKAARLIEYDNEGKNRRYDIVVQEGRNREVRRIFEHFGLTVTKLTRIRFGVIGIPPRLKRGQFYELNEVETGFVMKEMGLEAPKMKRKRK